MRHFHTLALLTGLAAAAVPALAQEKSKTITFYNPAWSPDGQSIVFESNRATPKSAIYTIRADGSGLTRLTAGEFEDTQASFAPDGKRVAFQGRANNARVDDHVYVVNTAGNGWRQLTDTATNSMSPAWTADRQWIVFDQHPVTKWLWAELQRADLKPMQDLQAVYAIRPDGSGLRRYPGKMPSSDIAPDGRFRAVAKTVDKVAGLYILEIATAVERLLLSGAP